MLPYSASRTFDLQLREAGCRPLELQTIELRVRGRLQELVAQDRLHQPVDSIPDTPRRSAAASRAEVQARQHDRERR